MKLKPLLTLLFLLLSSVVAADTDYQRLLKTELSKLDYASYQHWKFTETTIDNEDVTVAKYDPTRAEGQRWSLVSHNNQVASYQQMVDYRSDKSDEIKKQRKRQQAAVEDGEPLEGGFVELVDWSSLRVIETSKKHVILHFQPLFDRFDEEEQALLVGVATFDRNNKQLLSVSIFNRDLEGSDVELPVESFSMKIDAVYIDGSILLKHQSSVVRELTSLFGGGEERLELKYSDYQAVK